MKKILLLITTFLVGVNIAFAADYKISVGNTKMTKGGSTKLTINGSSGITGRFDIKTSDASVVSVAESKVWIENNSYGISLKALKVGSATITVTPTNVSPTGLSAKTIKINVSLPREKSANNNLKSLAVEGYEITPNFDANVLEYNLTVPSTVNKINIQATKADNYASIAGNGEFEVEEGPNEFSIVVTSETKVEKIYKLTVTVEDLNPIEVKIDNKKYTIVKNIKYLSIPENYIEQTVKINDSDIPSFYNEKTKYNLVGLKDENGNIELYIYKDGKYSKYVAIENESLKVSILPIQKVLEGFKKETVKIGNNQIEVLKYTHDSNFALVYGINDATGEKAYYEYDLKNNAFSRYNDEIACILSSKNTKYGYTILISSILATIFFILMITFAICNNKKKKLIKKYLTKQEEPAPISIKNVIKETENEEETYELFKDDEKKNKSKKSKSKASKSE